MHCGKVEMTYDKALSMAYATYERYRNFHAWAMEHCSDVDAATRSNMVEQDAIMWAEVRGQLMFIARMFAWNDMDETTIHIDLTNMYYERHEED